MSMVTLTIDHLRELRILGSFNDSELSELLAIGEIQHHDEFSNVIIEGELSWGLYFIMQGVVGVYKTNKMSGTNYEIGQVHQGGFFGEMSLIDENPRSATIQTLTPCSLLKISKEDFFKFMSRSPDRQQKFFDNCIKALVLRLRELDDNFVISQYQLWRSALSKSEGEAA